MKSIITVSLLSLWIFAVVGPSVITLLDSGDSSVIVMSLNKEEQKQGEEDGQEKQLASDFFAPITPSLDYKDRITYTFYLMRYITYTQEIHLPPPEPAT